ncbi:cold shock domain-containing protein [Candidatus Bathyarchaeota archaeon]|nr:MAG: cold shock domain-containing protein [Candidatus Bathyarchaeota archaeon]
MRGTIKTWHYDEGFGFIAAESRKDIFCHSRDVQNCYDLDKGDVVEFEIEKTNKGIRAVNVKIVYN